MVIPECPVETVLMFLGDKSKTLIIGYLLKQQLRPSQLRKKIGKISKNTLSTKLKELEEQEIIERKVFEENPTKIIYSLTDFGKSFCSIILSMEEWGLNYISFI